MQLSPINAAMTNGAHDRLTKDGDKARRQARRVARARKPPVDPALDGISRSGLFDKAWYRLRYEIRPKVDALADWFERGCKSGFQPNLCFQPDWYLAQYRDVEAHGINPLVHYIDNGEAEGRKPSPLFDPAWYRQTYNPPSGELCLAHYLRLRGTGTVNPLPGFDANFYLSENSDVAEAGVDPFSHFMEQGFRENRDPSPSFDTAFYRSRYLRNQPDANPLLDYRERRERDLVFVRRPLHEETIPAEMRRFTRPGEFFEEFQPLPPGAPRRAMVLAYYLPQFHATRENDAWWGKGFTEWTNLARGLPRFGGHYQPRTPRDLGFYDLNDPATMRRQIAMAKAAGLGGFIFYFYWFDGERLLDSPIERFLADPTLDMPFCLMWANENWTRRWDGLETEILISQDYRPSDDESLIRCFARHFADPRYIRLQGRPVLMIYRPNIIPDATGTIARWREMFQRITGEDPLMVMAQGFGAADPREFGLDGAVEFPPHKLCADLPSIADSLMWFDPDAQGKIVRFEDAVRQSLDEPTPPFPLIKTACPGWDNDARREGKGMVVHGATPAAFEHWVSELVDRARTAPFFGKAIVCINAWNEWAEGAYLEPDTHFGAAFLNAASRAISAAAPPHHRAKFLLVGHDAHRHGAQTLLLELGRKLRAAHGLAVEFLLLDGGPMLAQYAAEAPTAVLSGTKDLEREINGLLARGFTSAIVNSVASGRACVALAERGVAPVLLVHELPSLIREKSLTGIAVSAVEAAKHAVFPSTFVRDAFVGLTPAGVDLVGEVILPQGVYQPVVFDLAARLRVRAEFGVPAGARLLLGLGYGDLRKGFDLFLQLWRASQGGNEPVHCLWAGKLDTTLTGYLQPEISAAMEAGSFHLAGFRRDVAALLSAADVFVLTSREDPFPSTVLEALAAGLPSVAFLGSGGVPEMLAEFVAGEAMPMGNVAAMALAARQLGDLADVEIADRRERLAAIAEEYFDFGRYARDIVDHVDPTLLEVSVAVPNYNYAQYLPERLGAIFGQTLPVREVLLLDDASTDDSLSVARETAETWRRDLRILPNERNSGAVLRQWRKAAEAVSGRYLWIAEADDDSDPRFLEKAVAALDAEPAAVMAFTDSASIDEAGETIEASYQHYYNISAPGFLTIDGVFPGGLFLERCLSERNLILNVSSVVWRRSALLAAFERCEAALDTFMVAGDWRLYAEVLSVPGARIAYVALPLNRHRRHRASVTRLLDADRHVAEIAAAQAAVARFLPLQSARIARQKQYLEEVSKQLGAGGMPPRLRDPTKRAARARSSKAGR
jgi:glycosyltransferase involved in cell wall biosynthesis